MMQIKKFLNVVYDNWDKRTGTPLPNLQNILGENKFRVVNGLFYFYNIQNYINCHKLDSVYENKKEKFYYFINGINDIYNTILNNDGKLPLPPSVEKCFIECDNFNIVFLSEHEYETEECFKLLIKISSEKNFDTSRIYIVNNNSKLDYYKEKYQTEINVHSLDFLPQINARSLVEFGVPNFIEDKENFFMSHNRTIKAHRYCLLIKLKKMNLLHQVDWSLTMGWERKRVIENQGEDLIFYKNILSDDEIEDLKDEIKFFESIDIKKSKYEGHTTWFDADFREIDWSKVFVYKTYENSYINITTESCYFQNEIHITDKTIKPLYFYQIPIFLASYQHVSYVKSRYGFDVFEDIIDHSYDDEKDNKIRFKKIIKEIERLSKNKNEIIDFYKKNRDRFEYNRNKVIEIKNSINDVNFLISLI
jgi:hypothetical protein